MAFVQHTADLDLRTRGEVEVVDLTPRLREVVAASGVEVGQCLA